MDALLPFQIAVTVFGLFAITRVILRAKDRQISFRALIFWLVVWIIIIGVSYLPNYITAIANSAGIGRGVDFMIYISIGLLYYLCFRQYVMLQTLEKKISSLGSAVAISQTKSKKGEGK